MMNKKFILWGATGQAKIIWELLDLYGFKIIAIFDNNPAIKTLSPTKKVPIFHGKEGFYRWKNLNNLDTNEILGIPAIGGARGKDRIEIQEFFIENGFKPYTAIHPRAFVSNDVILGNGCQILANATITSEALLGNSCIINTAASVDHECVLGNGVHIGPGARLAGCVQVGDYSFVGTGATVLPRIRIGKNAIVGAGAVVTKDVEDNSVVVGNPARILQK